MSDTISPAPHALLLTEEQLVEISEQTAQLLEAGALSQDPQAYREMAIEVLLKVTQLYGHIEALNAQIIALKKGQ